MKIAILISIITLLVFELCIYVTKKPNEWVNMDRPHYPQVGPHSQVYSKDDNIFYDGEGNKIPNRVIHILVLSKFVQIMPSDKDSLDKYFYAGY